MPSSSSINVVQLRRIVQWTSIDLVWPIVVSTGLLTIGLSLPWMQLYHPSFRGQSPFHRAAGGVAEEPLWLLLGIVMILLGLVRSKYRALWLTLLTLACSVHVWFAHDTLQSWVYLNQIELDRPLVERAPLATPGFGLYLSSIGIVMTFAFIIGYRARLQAGR
jgi:hypothetical protein